jgi:hypothetical protein
VGCAALADHLRTASWPSKFRPHLPEKYDGTSNLSKFLQVYVTAITAAGENTAVMATYFHVVLSGPARTWLMNLAPGSIYSWEELCARFVANFASAYQQHGVEAHLHAVRQEPRETLRAFISRFTKVQGTIPRISDASIVTPQCHLGFFPKLIQPINTCKFSKRVNIKRKFRTKVYNESS